jgi:hypothetical protein
MKKKTVDPLSGLNRFLLLVYEDDDPDRDPDC